jgi:Domain of unknown function (DUF5049)
MMDPPRRLRVGPREQLTLTATEREVDGWRVAAVIAGERLAEWAVGALNEAARAAIAARVGGGGGEGGEAGGKVDHGGSPSPAVRSPVPGSWGPGGASRRPEAMAVLRPGGQTAPEGRRDMPRAGLSTTPAPAALPQPLGPLGVPRPSGRVVRMPPSPTGPPDPRTEIPSPVLAGIEAIRATGETDMLDWPAVAEIADRLGFSDTARWVRGNPRAYARGVLKGSREAGP